MKKIIFTLVTIAIIFVVKNNTLIVEAAEPVNFDANYYAANNPDVVAVVGSEPQALYDHYINFGKAEGRFKNVEEELTGIIQEDTLVGAVFDNLPYSTYVDVDINNQLVTYYENNTLVMQSPCVTGKTSAGRGTPRGTYSIKTHIPGKTLTGPTWKVWVDYWMRFTDSNIGLHDATWRSAEEFGGTTYVDHGSHGCVNLPHEFAAQLFNRVNIGTTVLVH